MRTLRTIIFILLPAFALAGAKAATGRLYTSRELSSAFVNCLTQTRQGYLWAGTGEGLDRFDGYHFAHYRHSDGDTTSLPHKLVTALFTSRRGTLFIGTAKGLARYDEANDRFVRISLPGKGGDTWRITQMTQLPDGRMLIGTAGGGLFELAEGQTRGAHSKRYSYRKGGDYVHAVGVDPKGRVWTGGNDGLVSCYGTDGRRLLSVRPGLGLPVTIVNGAGGDMIVVCKNGVIVFSGSLAVKSRATADCAISSAFFTEAHGLLLGTAHGLMRPNANGTGYEAVDTGGTDTGLGSTNVTAIFTDRQGNVWIGSAGRGLLALVRQRRAFTVWTLDGQGIRTGSNISSVARASDGGVWVTLRGASLYHFTPHGQADRKVAAPKGLNFIYRDREGQLWVGAATTLYRMDERSGHMTKVRTFDCDYLQAMAAPLTDPHLQTGGEAADPIFVATFGRGMAMIPRSPVAEWRGETFHMAQRDTKRGSVCNDWPFAMTVDSRGLLWIATSSGVSCYDPSRDTFRPFGWRNLLEGVSCLSVAEAGGGDIIIGTERGLYLFDRRRNRVAPFPHGEVLRDKSVPSIVTTRGGDFWCSSSAGLWHYVARLRQFVSHAADAGLPESEFTENTGLRLDDGRLLFAANGSMAVFSPSTVDGNGQRPIPPTLTAVIVDGRRERRKSLDFDYRVGDVTIEFSNFDFADAPVTVLEYRLDGGSWTALPQGQNAIHLAPPAPGTHQLDTRMAAGGLRSATHSLTLSVRQPWYRTPLACAVYIAAILSLAVYIYWRRKSRMRQREAMGRMQDTIDRLMAHSRRLKERQDAEVARRNHEVEQPKVADLDAALMDRIMQSINKHIGDADYNVEQMASDAGLSRAQLHRRMKELTGLSPAMFLRNLRLEQAARLLRQRKGGVSQVAYAVGFNSLNTFSKAFKLRFGQSPTEYAGQ